MSALIQMTVLQPGKAPQVCDLDGFQKSIIYLGRGPYHGSEGSAHNDVVIDESIHFVSRAQCSLYQVDGQWYLKDDSSKNGIWYHGRNESWIAIHDGDKVYLGNEELSNIMLLFSYRREASTQMMNGYSLSEKQQFSIGRDAQCDIVINSSVVSRVHSIITYENGQYYITDNHSTNGTLLNGSMLNKKTLLRQMDKIGIADVSLIFSDMMLWLDRPQGGVSVVAEHLSRVVGKGKEKKCIANDISLTLNSNEFVAIIGGSGAGKTTLLNCLSGLSDFEYGDVFVNGESIRTAKKNLRSIMGYVPQQDILYDSLSLERMLNYSAQLRMPKDTSAAEIQAKIDETLEIVELSEHKNTLIKKLSGGQRKRASIAVELLASPKLFFLDEPSSGLDPGTEKHLMRMLKRLSQSGKTVIMVTHTVQNLDLCDRVVCMGKGGLLCFSGTPKQALQFFQRDSLIDIFDILNEAPEASAQAMKERYEAQAGFGSAADQAEKSKSEKTSFALLFHQFRVLGLRYCEIFKNSASRLVLLMLIPFVITILVCFAYQADGGLFDLLHINIVRQNFAFLVAQDTMSLVSAFSCAAFWVGIFNSVQEISKERVIYQREKFTGVAVIPYLMSKFSVLTLLCAVQAGVMTALLRFLSGTVATVSAGTNAATNLAFGMSTQGAVFQGNMFWLELYITTFLCVISAMCLGLAISSLVSNDIALVLCPICLLPQILFSGVATPLSGMTDVLSRIVSCRWSCIALLTSVNVNDLYVSCSFDNQWKLEENSAGLVDAAYAKSTTYLFGLNPVVSAWLALIIISMVCLTISFLVLRYRKERMR